MLTWEAFLPIAQMGISSQEYRMAGTTQEKAENLTKTATWGCFRKLLSKVQLTSTTGVLPVLSLSWRCLLAVGQIKLLAELLSGKFGSELRQTLLNGTAFPSFAFVACKIKSISGFYTSMSQEVANATCNQYLVPPQVLQHPSSCGGLRQAYLRCSADNVIYSFLVPLLGIGDLDPIMPNQSFSCPGNTVATGFSVSSACLSLAGLQVRISHWLQTKSHSIVPWIMRLPGGRIQSALIYGALTI